MTCLMWFRDDLRLHDNQALSRAAEAAALGDAPDTPNTPTALPASARATNPRERGLRREEGASPSGGIKKPPAFAGKGGGG